MALPPEIEKAAHPFRQAALLQVVGLL